VGVIVVEPLADVDVNDPGVMAMLEAPVAAQLSELLVPKLMLAGFAAKEVIIGAAPVPLGALVELVEPQPASAAQANRISASKLNFSLEESRPGAPRKCLPKKLAETMPCPQASSVYCARHRNRSSPWS
jgi:hypothetical protein